MDGFRFKGTHSSAFGCFYIPPANSLGSDMEDYTSMDQEIDGRDGGYHIGNRVGIREIQLECYFEDID